jgi:hypothetical protein
VGMGVSGNGQAAAMDEAYALRLARSSMPRAVLSLLIEEPTRYAQRLRVSACVRACVRACVSVRVFVRALNKCARAIALLPDSSSAPSLPHACRAVCLRTPQPTRPALSPAHSPPTMCRQR